jgi:hypothetical protein
MDSAKSETRRVQCYGVGHHFKFEILCVLYNIWASARIIHFLGLRCMARRSRKEAAARARAARHTCHENASDLKFNTEGNGSKLEAATLYVDLDFDDCGYTGGINHCFSSDDSESASDFEDLEDEDSDDESLAEFEGDALEENLQELLLLQVAFPAPTQYEQIVAPKTKKEWGRAEKKRSLGYNGHSKRTKQRREMEAHQRSEMKDRARSS